MSIGAITTPSTTVPANAATATTASTDTTSGTATTTDASAAANGTSTATDASTAGTAAPQPLTVASSNAQLNASIIVATLDVKLTAQSEPLNLLYKTAVENLNAVLKPTQGDQAIQKASTDDNSPAATAGRIVSFVTNAFAQYSQMHPDQTSADSAQKFMALIQPGIEAGFKEGRDILKGLNVLNGDIASNVDKTYSLVQQGLAAFVAAQNVAGSGTATAGSSTADTSGASAASAASETTVTTSTTSISLSTSTTSTTSINTTA
ncbi:DUF5610 domain-containing protein [Herbaspirillum sp. RTI4]|uniref:DUF5610 domain-containing protein n=1 Tax=Herbaspirillum sp. RTI4 TaxID=3048640 RepID=UPI002AB42343|nr:DUF5610 domain-containing protein [Herbaspirillum sp. RTI4]MDY7576877.1 DUF5610 domain-containing protein [Herbaspirillum sp. RTI4]MEA9982516.1 DUF5610 domain-containing protein [Herbaspirillum sp. RTI4]